MKSISSSSLRFAGLFSLLFVGISGASPAQAAGHARVSPQISAQISAHECSVDLRYRGPRDARYFVSGSRLEGAPAQKRVESWLNAGAAPIQHQDSLGIVRYREVSSAKVAPRVMEQKWVGVGGCEGLVRALLVEVCTYDAANSACETQCRFDGNEGFCP